MLCKSSSDMGIIQKSFLIGVCFGLVLGFTDNFTDVNSNAVKSRSVFNSFPWAPLTIVKISNEKCDGGNGQSGTCIAKSECFWKGGTIRGSCAFGFGICCIMIAQENGVVEGNNTLLLKSRFNAGVNVTYTVMKMSEDICQYRLDVKRLYLYEVESDGNCIHDWMLINQDTKFQKVCGLTEDIHYYIDVHGPSAVFSFHTDPEINYSRDWKIYVSQYTCDMGAPEGCGQWYWGTTGTIDIWNNIDPSTTHWYYIDHQDYAVCIRWEAGYCSVTYNEKTRFQPRCNDLFERPGFSALPATCIETPPNAELTYTLYDGLQYFYIEFEDNTNQHVGTSSNPFKNPRITFQQNRCS